MYFVQSIILQSLRSKLVKESKYVIATGLILPPTPPLNAARQNSSMFHFTPQVNVRIQGTKKVS